MNPQTPLDKLFRLNDTQKKGLKKLGLLTAFDLLYYFPKRTISTGETRSITSLEAGDNPILYGTLEKLKTGKTYRSKKSMATGELHGQSGKIKLIWFNQPYIAKMFQNGTYVKLQGKVSENSGKLSIVNPDFEALDTIVDESPESLFGASGEDVFFINVYRETRGITSKWISYSIKKLIAKNIHGNISDPIPDSIRERLNLPSLDEALVWIHLPNNLSHSEAARKRFAFEEIFLFQMANAVENQLLQSLPSFSVEFENPPRLENLLPFSFTNAQSQALQEISDDMKQTKPMNRLLEGDVGSGKTAVAASAIYETVLDTHEKNFEVLQTAFMAPTEILAKQHFAELIHLLGDTEITIGLLTGSIAAKFPSKTNPDEPTSISKAQLKRYVERGDIDILVGTHALIQKTTQFKRLALVVIDEQHRFGVRQRQALARDKEGRVPHLLSMTATPIPRTLALTLYGSLSLSIIDEMPPGREPVQTILASQDTRGGVYEKVEEELKAGRQAYVVCARIHPSEKKNSLNLHNVTDTTKRLKKVFSGFKVEDLHGQMSANKKAQVMEKFLDGDIDILVSTTVIEVGVNVPNASVIIIENAERYGLAQLHQLRGRVLRSTHTPYCYIFSNGKSEKSVERLKLFASSSNGFELAEKDLERRGPGALIGKDQSGMSDLAMTALKNIKLVQAAQKSANSLIGTDPSLDDHPVLKQRIDNLRQKLHLE